MQSSADHDRSHNKSDGGDPSQDYAPYPKLAPADVAPPPPPPQATTMPSSGSNPYVTPSPAPSSSKNTIESVKDVFGKWGKKMGEAAKKTEDLAGNVWQHCE